MPTIEKRESPDGTVRYRVKVRLKGAPPETATFSRKTDAKRWAEQMQSAIREGRHFKSTEAKRRTVGELIDKYIAEVLPQKPRDLRNRKAQLLWWKAELGGLKLSELTPAVLSAARNQLLASEVRRQSNSAAHRKKSPATVRRYLAAFSHTLSVAVTDWNWIDDNPLRKVSKPSEARGRTRFLEREELERLLKACEGSKNPHLPTIVVLAVSTGMRQGEIMGLRCHDVDCATGRITLTMTKNGDLRVVPLAGRALQLLKARIENAEKQDDLLFPGRKPDRPSEISQAWTTAVKRAGLIDFRFHDLRHSAATFLVDAGATDLQIASVLGHRTLQMVRRYAHVRKALAADVVANMNAQIFPED
ncbi:MAG: tyrosine-type recombinase/integrase [Betaproteobacteria bacterium]